MSVADRTIPSLSLLVRERCDDAIASLRIERQLRSEEPFTPALTSPAYQRASAIASAMIDARLRWFGLHP